MVVPGSPGASKLLRHPLARAAGGDVFHGGGQHWTTKSDPDWQVLEAWVNGATLAAYAKPATDTRVARIVQTNAAGDNIHLIDPATNKVVGGHQRHRSAARGDERARRHAALFHQRVAAYGRCRRWHRRSR